MQGNLTDPQTPILFWEKAVEEICKIDVLVNNAATHTYKKLTEMKLEEITRLIQVNYLGVLLMSQQAVKYMSETGK